MATFNTTRLVAQVKLKGAIADGRFQDSEILDLATDALVSEVAPILITTREEYYVRSRDYTVTADQANYLIPSRAVGGVLREVKMVRGTEVVDLIRMDLEDVDTTETGRPCAFYIQGDNLVLFPTPDATGDILRTTFFCRPNSLVEPSACAQITAIVGNVLTITTPADWSTLNTFDIIRGDSGFSIKGMDLTASAVNLTDITLDNLPQDVVVGDWVCLASESCFPFIPADAHQLLVHLTVVACLEALGDQANLPIAAARAGALKDALKAVLTQRVQGAPQRFGTTLI